MSDHPATIAPTEAVPPKEVPQPDAGLRKGTDWWAEAKGMVWLLLAVLAFHSLIAKPFYIPSESMMPTLIKGDRLVVTKYPYGWSYVSPSFHVLPFVKGRLFGKLPERGDVVIAKPPQADSDYIKRVVGLPGDRIEVRRGILILNGVPVKREERGEAMIPIDANVPCLTDGEIDHAVVTPEGKRFCALPLVRETLPNGRSYDTIDLGPHASQGDDYGPVVVPAGHVFLMGDNRDESADSRYSLLESGLGGPLPIENLGGRAEFITFSLDGTSQWFNPISWITALRGGRAGTSLHPTKGPQPK